MNRLNIFLRFPETDEEVLEFIDNQYLCEDLSKSICQVKSYLRDKGYNYCLLYDSKNINEFKHKVAIIDDGVYLSNISTGLRKCISTYSQDIDKISIYDNSMTYAVWDCYSSTANKCFNNVIISASEYCVSSEEDTIVWIFAKNNNYKRDIIPVVIDAPHKNPVLSITPLCETAKDCIHWIHSIENSISFSLKDQSLFEKTQKIYHPSKQRIYKKRDDNTFWYYDYFHHNNSEHYEVFDKNGSHIGEADMLGIIDNTKKDPQKSISGLI